MSIYVFDAKLEEWGPFVTAPASRKLALSAGSHLGALHALIQEAFGWDDDHLYSFWLDGEFWGAEESEYTLPFELEEREGANSSETRMDTLGLEVGRKIAYIFDFGDEWRVTLTLTDIRDAGDIGILESVGEAPAQYPDYDEEE